MPNRTAPETTTPGSKKMIAAVIAVAGCLVFAAAGAFAVWKLRGGRPGTSDVSSQATVSERNIGIVEHHAVNEQTTAETTTTTTQPTETEPVTETTTVTSPSETAAVTVPVTTSAAKMSSAAANAATVPVTLPSSSASNAPAPETAAPVQTTPEQTEPAISETQTQTSVSADTSERHEPFYALMCMATKTYDNAQWSVDYLKANGYDPHIIVSCEWSNFNPERWYCVTAGYYETEEAAKADLPALRAVYPDAYVKYSGCWQGE